MTRSKALHHGITLNLRCEWCKQVFSKVVKRIPGPATCSKECAGKLSVWKFSKKREKATK